MRIQRVQPAWPEGYRAAAWFTFDLDADEIWNLRIERDEDWDKPTVQTRGNYGPRVAVPRILDLFDRYDLPCTFFIPGRVAEEWPDVVRDVHEAGHEIGLHGYRHVNPAGMSRSEEAQSISRSIEIFEDLVDLRPVGYRSPAADMSDHTLSLLADHGVEYDSSFIDDDQPYYHEVDGDTLLEIPFDWSLDDWPYFGYHMYPQLPYQSGISPTGPVFDSWRREFDGLNRRGGCFVLTMHPQMIGRAGRIDALESLLQHVIATDDTWIATGREIARHLGEQEPR